MGMGASPDPTSGKGSSPTQPTSGKGSGQPVMGQPNQYMQGQTGNGDPNNSTGTVQTPQPTVSAPSNDYRSTIGMPQWDAGQIGNSAAGKTGSALNSGGKMGNGGSKSSGSDAPLQPAPSGGKGMGDMSQSVGASQAPVAAPDAVPSIAPYVPPAPQPVAAPVQATPDQTGVMSAQDRLIYSMNKGGR